jgi:hypothetical protein
VRAVIAHKTTKDRAIALVDRSSGELFDFGSKHVALVDQTKSWNGNVMTFSMTAKAGFIALPLAGTVTVDDVNVVIDCDLPALVKQFIGEDKLKADIERHLTTLLA